MVLPLVPLALIATGVVGGVGGAGLAGKGALSLRAAKRRIKQSGIEYEEARKELEEHEALTNDLLAALGNRQEQAVARVVERMADFLRRHEKQVAESEKLLVDGLEPGPGRVVLDGGLGQDAISWLRGVGGAAAAGYGINATITVAVTTLASASTGTAIASLSGAAAVNATLAFLGGGSVAAGGGGMAVGAAALNFVTIGPALLVSGFAVAGQGEKAKTKAVENEAEIGIEIAAMQVTKTKFDAIASRVNELSDLLDELEERSITALDLLESEPFDPQCHATRFQNALVLTVAVCGVATAEVVNASGDLSEDVASVIVRYRPLTKEPRDV